MNKELIMGIVDNAVLMLSLVIVYSLLPINIKKQGKNTNIISGAAIGVIVIVVMLIPFNIGDGVVLDTRSIIISLTGVFFGFIPMLITVILSSVLRIISGGAGTLTCVSVIFTSGMIGYFFRNYFFNKIERRPIIRLLSIYSLGLVVHIVMLAMFLWIPGEVKFSIITSIQPYVLILYPIFTVLLGQIMFMKNDSTINNNLLVQSKENFEKAIDSAPIPMVLYSSTGSIIKLNKEFTKISGYSIDDLPTVEDWAIKAFGPVSAKALEHIQNNYASEERVFDSEVKVKTKSNEIRLWDFYSDGIGTLPDGQKAILSIAIDVTDKKAILDQLEYLSFHDEMTGLYNRRFFETEVKRLHTKRNYPLAILVGDINGLKVINDSFGHIVGDELIIAAGNVLKKVFRSDDIIARIGGDEFVVLLPKTSQIEAEELIERIVAELHDTYVRNLKLSISFGSGVINSKTDTYDKTFIDAENIMYKNKMIDSPSVRGMAIDTILNTLFEKDYKTKEHSENVSKIAVLIAQELGFNHDKIQEIKAAGLLHDIGKIVTPISILNKLEKLSDEDFQEIYKHPEIGYRILDSGNNMGNIANIVLHHHERFDGTGYPKGIKGVDIPIESRIITIADSFEAMTNERPYKKALSTEQAIIEIERFKGIQFDPIIADIFIKKVMYKK